MIFVCQNIEVQVNNLETFNAFFRSNIIASAVFFNFLGRLKFIAGTELNSHLFF